MAVEKAGKIIIIIELAMEFPAGHGRRIGFTVLPPMNFWGDMAMKLAIKLWRRIVNHQNLGIAFFQTNPYASMLHFVR